MKALAFVGKEVANGKRIEEVILLKDIIKNRKTNDANVSKIINDMFHYMPTEATMNSVVNYLNLNFFKPAEKAKYGDADYIESKYKAYFISPYFDNLLSNSTFISG